MDASVDDNLRKEALHLYFSEVKDTQQETEQEEDEEEHVLLNGNAITLSLQITRNNKRCRSGTGYRFPQHSRFGKSLETLPWRPRDQWGPR